MYIFFHRAFATSLFSPFFDPTAPFLGVPLYIAYPDPVPPHQAQSPVVPPYPIQPESSKSDPLEMMDSSCRADPQTSCQMDSSLRDLLSGVIQPWRL